MPKRKLENGQQRLASQNHRSRTQSLEISGQGLGRTRLTDGNVEGSSTRGAHTEETVLVGWGGRIRTSEWRNQNSPQQFDLTRLFLPTEEKGAFDTSKG